MVWKDSEAAKEYKRFWYEQHKQKRCQQEKDRARSLRIQVLNKLGGCCTVCGWTDWRALQLDHIQGGGHQERIRRKSTSWGACDYRRMLLDLDLHLKLQVLCANHNWIKKYENDENANRFKDA